MSAGSAVEERLDGISLDDSPPCETLRADKNWEVCGQPSVIRLRLSCCYVRAQFVCAECFQLMKECPFRCRRCLQPVKWSVL